MLAKGSKLIVTKDVASFLKEGSVVEVVDVEDDLISFAFGEDFMHKGIMNLAECEAHFEEYEETKEESPTVSLEKVDAIIKNSHIVVQTVFDKCTIVSCKLPNGFVIVESSACVSTENYDANVGFEICMNRIKDKIFELEAYKLSEELYGCDCDDCECCGECTDDCPCYDEDCECDEDDGYDCLTNDFDCDECPSKSECWL